ncbi:MFS transporter [Brevibacillus sp. SYSU BS000544]|uniref:MFS transporter n=1 Tax=Brevibacillus sp. SYSU BS000544 TaxID=3416443 RepID=UPI003CE5787E
MKEVFRQPDFQKLFYSNLFSGFGVGMSMIGISWHLVKESGSAQVLGSTMFISAVLSFFIVPYIGTLIDRYSRKNILLQINAAGFIVIGLCALWGYTADYNQWMLIGVFLVTNLIMQVHYPTQSALVQESFADRHYNSINSLLEIESQTASVLAGGISGIILESMGLPFVLLFDALTYLFAFFLLSRMNYTFTLNKRNQANGRKNWLHQLGDSWIFVREKKGFVLFGITAFLPFVAVMVGNLLAPVFVSQTLKADVIIFSAHEMTYAIGAVAAGFLIIRLSEKVGNMRAMIANMMLFALTLVCIVALPYGWMFVFLTTFLGWGNASVRLVRQNLYMRMVPKEHMGRVLSFFQSIGMLMRLLLLGLFTVLVDWTGAGTGYLILAVLVFAGAIGCYYSMRILLVGERGTIRTTEQ